MMLHGVPAMQAAAGGVVALMSAMWASVEPIPSTLWEAGPWVMFTASLMYSVAHLWLAMRRDREAQRKRDEAREKREREEGAARERRYAEAFEAERSSRERLAEALERLGKER